MKRYYFYSTGENRTYDRKQGLIYFHLKALFAEKCYSQKLRKEVLNFHYFDDIYAGVNTRLKGVYRFEIETGRDGCMGELATTTAELHTRLNKYKRITEKQYFRLRALAINLMIRHTAFFNKPETGTDGFAYRNKSGYLGTYDLTLSAHNELFNRKGEDAETLEWRKKEGFSRYDVTEQETMAMHSNRNNPGEKPYNAHMFRISANGVRGMHSTIEESMKSTYYGDYDLITLPQYERLRKFFMNVVLDRISLDISPLKKKQTSSITILNW